MSIVSICNRALSKLGDDVSILSLDDDSKQARYCKALYEDTKNFVLRSYAWRFAIKRYSLAPTGEILAFGSGNVFNMPSDCLRVLALEDDSCFNVEGKKILSDNNPLNFYGIQLVSDTDLFDACFVEVLATYLAIDLCIPLTNNVSMKNELRQSLQEAVAVAKKCNAFENYPTMLRVVGALESRL